MGNVTGKIIAIVFALVFCCCSPKIIKETTIEYRDRIVHDTAVFNVPVEVEKIVTKDTVSILENTFARSEANVSGGFLSHSLESKPQIIKVPVEVHVTDTLWKESQIIEKEVEKPLSKWKSFQLESFWWLLAAVALLVIWTFRKPLVGLIKKFL